MEPLLLKKGDLVKLEYEGRKVTAIAAIATTNGRSLMLEFDAMLGGYVGMMPVLWMDNYGYIDLVAGKPVFIERTA